MQMMLGQGSNLDSRFISPAFYLLNYPSIKS